MSYFTCISCGVAFSSGEIQRAHYKSDWHRYNLKRKVSELPPVSAENFTQRVLANRAQAEEANGQLTGQATASEYCKICRKHFTNPNSYENHLKSRKHLELLQNCQSSTDDQVQQKIEKNNVNLTSDSKSLVTEKDVKNVMNAATSNMVVDDDEEEEEWEEIEGEALQLEECLFCSHLSSNFEDNIQHMTEGHSFFIPDIEYVVDLSGLIGYLGEKVGVGNVCLWCNEKGKSFYSTKSAQQHMTDKGHCKMLHEGAALEEYSDFYDYSQSYPDNDVDEDDGEDVAANVLEDEGFQLVLPSGATIGHRSLMRYYRQNLRPVPLQSNRKAVTKVMSQYRALGWTGTTGDAAIRKAKDLSLMHMKRSKHYMQLGVKHNKLQTHFRQQNPI